jgi:hypothetical protein
MFSDALQERLKERFCEAPLNAEHLLCIFSFLRASYQDNGVEDFGRLRRPPAQFIGRVAEDENP